MTEVVDRILACVWRPRKRAVEWQAWIMEAAERLRNFLVSQPAGLHVYLLGPVVSPTAVDRMNAMLGALRGAGIDEEGVWRAYATVHTYTVGFAALQASRGHPAQGSGPSDPLIERLASCTTRDQFEVGLRYLIEGIERDVAPTPAGEGSETTA